MFFNMFVWGLSRLGALFVIWIQSCLLQWLVLSLKSGQLATAFHTGLFSSFNIERLIKFVIFWPKLVCCNFSFVFGIFLLLEEKVQFIAITLYLNTLAQATKCVSASPRGQHPGGHMPQMPPSLATPTPVSDHIAPKFWGQANWIL